MNRPSVAAAALLILATASWVFAHDTWLIPDRFVIVPGSLVSLDLTSGMAFPALDTSIKPERIDRASCRLGGHSLELSDYLPTPKSLVFKTTLSESGIAAICVDLKPKSLVLTDRLVLEYLDEIGAPAAVRQQWERARRPRRWREVYTKHAKTFVRVGNDEADRSWAEPVGVRLEIVPETDPTALRIGDNLVVRVLKDGTALPSFSVGIVGPGNAKGSINKTDAAGRVTFPLNRAGRWMVRVTELRKSSQAEIDWESDFATLTLQVGSK